MTLYARISPLGSSGVSQIMRAVVRLTSGKDTLDGGPGAVKQNIALFWNGISFFLILLCIIFHIYTYIKQYINVSHHNNYIVKI